jgi:hypothetical protein
MPSSLHLNSVSLSILQKFWRGYAVWWDLINTGIIVFLLSVSFIFFSVVLLAGRVDLLPFQDLIWKQFVATVSMEKQSEIGVGVLGVTVSGASAAALYLIRVGTSRWAMNRRIGYIHGYFAQEIAFCCSDLDFNYSKTLSCIVAFINSAQNIFEQISETHPKAQILFERARMRSHCYCNDPESHNLDAICISIDLYAASLLCQKKIYLPSELKSLSHRISAVV